jgi:cytochrome P450
MSDKQVRDEVMTIFIAGHETTANALTWTFYLLSQNQDVELKLHDEINSVLGDSSGNNVGNRIPTAYDIPKLQYTEKLYPPVWTIGRHVENDYSIGEYTIPAGSSILMSQYVMHHNPRYYEEPEQFNPGRWTEEFKTHLPRFSYFQFGGGISTCYQFVSPATSLLLPAFLCCHLFQTELNRKLIRTKSDPVYRITKSMIVVFLYVSL